MKGKEVPATKQDESENMPARQKKLPPLWACILLDAVGYVSLFFPGIGETTDLIWAPLSGLLFYIAFGGKTGVIGAAIAFAEEILPWTDVIPVFTLGYFLRKSGWEDRQLAKKK